MLFVFWGCVEGVWRGAGLPRITFGIVEEEWGMGGGQKMGDMDKNNTALQECLSQWKARIILFGQ